MGNFKSLMLITVLTAIFFLLCAKISKGQDTIINVEISGDDLIIIEFNNRIDTSTIEYISINTITQDTITNDTNLVIDYTIDLKWIFITNKIWNSTKKNIQIKIQFDYTYSINDNNIPIEKTVTAIYNINGQLITKEQSYNQICIIRYKDGYIEKRYVVRR